MSVHFLPSIALFDFLPDVILFPKYTMLLTYLIHFFWVFFTYNAFSLPHIPGQCLLAFGNYYISMSVKCSLYACDCLSVYLSVCHKSVIVMRFISECCRK